MNRDILKHEVIAINPNFSNIRLLEKIFFFDTETDAIKKNSDDFTRLLEIYSVESNHSDSLDFDKNVISVYENQNNFTVDDIIGVKNENERVWNFGIFNETVNEFSCLVKPDDLDENPVSLLSTSIHDISNEDLIKEGKSRTEVLARLEKLFKRIASEDAVLVAHNLSFDYKIVKDNYPELNEYLQEMNKLCTYRLARHLFPTLGKWNLSLLHLIVSEKVGRSYKGNKHYANSDVQKLLPVLPFLLSIYYSRYGSLDKIYSRINAPFPVYIMPIGKWQGFALFNEYRLDKNNYTSLQGKDLLDAQREPGLVPSSYLLWFARQYFNGQLANYDRSLCYALFCSIITRIESDYTYNLFGEMMLRKIDEERKKIQFENPYEIDESYKDKKK